MGGDESGTALGASAAVHAARRAELIELLTELPETRLSKPTPRHGWTLRHELAWLAAADEELLQRLEHRLSGATDEPHWRRVRGQAMHTAQEMRLAALRDHLEASGARVSASLEAHEDRLREGAIRDALTEHLGHSDAAIATVRAILAK